MPRNKKSRGNHAANYDVPYEGPGGNVEDFKWDGEQFILCHYHDNWYGCHAVCVNNMMQHPTATNIFDIGRINGVLETDELQADQSNGMELFGGYDDGLVDVQNVAHCMIEFKHWGGKAGQLVAAQEYTYEGQTIAAETSPVRAFSLEDRQKLTDILNGDNPVSQMILCTERTPDVDGGEAIPHFIGCWHAVGKDGWLMSGGEAGAKALYVGDGEIVPLLFTEHGRSLLSHRLSCAFGEHGSVRIRDGVFIYAGCIQQRQPLEWGNMTPKEFKLRADGRTVLRSRGEHFGGVHALRLVKRGDTNSVERLSVYIADRPERGG